MKRLMSVVLVLVMILNSAVPAMAYNIESRWNGVQPFFSYMVQAEGGQPSENLESGFVEMPDYFIASSPTYGSVIKSYLAPNGTDGYIRIEAIGEKVYVEEYSKDFAISSMKEIEMELDEFGGCFVGEKYNFLVFGQENPEDSDEVEVLRVVKYDKNWNRIGVRSVYGANTSYPFDAGSLRMTEVNDTLYIHTCHQMYASDDGSKHQANMTFVLDEESLEVTQQSYKVENIDVGYVSHSFNQFVVSDGTCLYRLDHGDAYPRAVIATKCPLENIGSCKAKAMTVISAGKTGQNATGVSVGGFELGGDYLLSTGLSVDYDKENVDMSGVRNVYLTSTNKDYSTGVKEIWLTDFDENSTFAAGVPKLVKASEDIFYVMWQEMDLENKLIYFRYAKVTADGEVLNISDRIYGRMSDCQPIYNSDGKIVWYVTNNGSPVFFCIDPEQPEMYKFSKIDFAQCDAYMQGADCVFSEFENNEMPEIVKFKGYTLKKDVDYTVTYSVDTINYVGVVNVTIEGKGYFSGKKELSYIIRPEAPYLTWVYNRTHNSLVLRWDKSRCSTGYQVEQKTDGKWTFIKDVTETECEVTGLKDNTEYEFRIRAYTKKDDEIFYGPYKEMSARTHLYIESPSAEITEVEPDYVTISWNEVKDAQYYTVSWFENENGVSTPVSIETSDLSYKITDLSKINAGDYRYFTFYVQAVGTENTPDGDEPVKSESNVITLDKNNPPYYRISEDTVAVVSEDNLVYTGNMDVKPEVSVRVNKLMGFDIDKLLLEGTDYEISYYDNTGIGTAKMVITGIGTCRGNVEKTFKIMPSEVINVTCESEKNAINLKWDSVPGAEWYNIYSYADGSWNLLETSDDTAYTSDNLLPDTEYKYKITGCAKKDGETYESTYACENTFTTKGTSDEPGGNDDPIVPEREKISSKNVTLKQTKYTYNGKTIKPEVEVKNKAGRMLYEGTDYKILYSAGRKNPGVYTVTVKGISGYSGTIKKTFKICPKSAKFTGWKITRKRIELKWNKPSKQISGYEIQYADNEKFKNSTKITISKVSTKSYKKNVKWKSGKCYRIRIRTYKNVKVNGENVKIYSEWYMRQTYLY